MMNSPGPTRRKRTRALHTKSRKGCFSCKSRKVKCDEVKPRCGACALRGESCDWPAEPVFQHQHQHQHQHNTKDRSKRVGSAAASESPHALQFDFGFLGSTQSQELNMVDLRLQAHFMLHTSKHMTLSPRRRHIWETVIPQFAMSNKALMHLLLALAGMDLLTSDRHRSVGDIDIADLQVVVVEHHQRGLEAYRKELSNLSDSNLHHVFAGSMLLVGFALASLRVRNLTTVHHLQPSDPDAAPPPPPTPRLDWIHLIQGLCTVVQHNWPELRMGPLREMTQFPHSNDDWRMYSPESFQRILSSPPPHAHCRQSSCSPRLLKFALGAYDALDNLKSFYDAESESGRLSPDDAFSPLQQAQTAALDVLEQMYMRTLYVLHFSSEDLGLGHEHGHGSPTTSVLVDLENAALMSWPQSLPREFLAALHSSGDDDDYAMGSNLLSHVILAYLYLNFSLFELFWYIGDGFDEEVRKIDKLVLASGDENLSSLMRWPLSVISVVSSI